MSRYFGMSAPSDVDGTWSTQDGTLATFLAILNENISEDNAIIFDSDVSNRSPRGQSAGPFNVSGGVTFNVRPDTIGPILLSTFGSEVVATPSGCTSAVGVHQYRQNDTLPHYTGEFSLDNPGQIGTRRYNLMTDSLDFTHDPEGRLECTANVLGRLVDISNSASTPSFSTQTAFVFHMATMSVAGAANTDIEELSWSFNNSLQRKPEPNTRAPGKYKPGELVIEGTLAMSLEDFDNYNLFLGSSVATVPSNTIADVELGFNYTSFTFLEACAQDEHYRLQFTFPKVTLMTYNANLNARDRIVENIGWRALYDATTASAVTVLLTNLNTVGYIKNATP